MAIRTDVTVDWSQSPRLITVASPSISISIQDLNDTLRNIEAKQEPGMQFSTLLISTGKQNLGGGLLVGVTLTLQNAQLSFAARTGPTTIQCTVSGGNLVAVDSNNNPINSISPTAFTQVVIAQSTDAALLAANFLTLQQFLALK